jgi:hypothetical protein
MDDSGDAVAGRARLRRLFADSRHCALVVLALADEAGENFVAEE